MATGTHEENLVNSLWFCYSRRRCEQLGAYISATAMRYLFENCEIDPGTRELRRAGEQIDLEPQVFDLLIYLIENKSELVTVDDLIESVWRGRIVSDSAITARISAARKAVGDNGKEQRIIKTLPRKGFKWLATVDSLATTPDDNHAESIPATSTSDHQKIRFCTSANGAQIAYAVTGTGVPLLRTGHWLTHLEHDWHNPIWRPFLSQLGAQFEVVRYDQRGCGLTDWRITDFCLERFVEDLEAVADASGHKRFVLYATSQGVPVAITYAIRNPERVSHLICHGGYAEGRLVRKDQSEVEQGEAILKLIEHGWGKSNSPFLKSFTTMYIPDATKEQMDSLVDLQRLSTNTDNAVAIRRAVDNFDVTALLPKVNVKTLVIHADNDGVHPISQGRELAAGIPNSEFVLLDSSNHTVLPEESAWRKFFQELKRFTAS